jgi:hypothetical protein
VVLVSGASSPAQQFTTWVNFPPFDIVQSISEPRKSPGMISDAIPCVRGRVFESVQWITRTHMNTRDTRRVVEAWVTVAAGLRPTTNAPRKGDNLSHKLFIYITGVARGSVMLCATPLNEYVHPYFFSWLPPSACSLDATELGCPQSLVESSIRLPAQIVLFTELILGTRVSERVRACVSDE